MIAVIFFIFYIKASLLQTPFTSKLIDLNCVGRLNLSERFHLDSDLAWSDGSFSRYYTGLGMVDELNETLLAKAVMFYYSEKLSLYTINIHDAHIRVGKPVSISDFVPCNQEQCVVKAQAQVARNWTVEAKEGWRHENWKVLLKSLLPWVFFEEKVISKPLLKRKGPGVWAIYFKESYLTLDGSVMKDNLKTNRTSSTSFRATFPLSRNNELLGLIGYYNVCSSSMPVLSGNNQEEEIQRIQSSYCAKNDLDIFYQNY